VLQFSLPGLEGHDYHDFTESLQWAEVDSNLLQLGIFYRSCFPGVVGVSKVVDPRLQRQGVDTVVELQSGKQIYFDEKIRRQDYGDILLEEYSVWPGYPRIDPKESNAAFLDCPEPIEVGVYELVPEPYDRCLTLGWVNGVKVTDYITYVVKPSKKVYFLPFLLLQRAWGKYYSLWLRSSPRGRLPAQNRTYVTTNIPVPVEVLYHALFEEANWVDED